VIDYGPGLAYVPLVAALFPLGALAVAFVAIRGDTADLAAQPGE